MLFLPRKVGESVAIGDLATLTVLEIRGDSVRLGLEADPSVTIHREEVAIAIKLASEGRGAIGPAEVKRRLAWERGTLDAPRRRNGEVA